MQTLPGASQEYKLALSVLRLLRASGTSHPLPSVEKQMAALVGGGRGGGFGLVGDGSGGGEKPLLHAVVWDKAVVVLVLSCWEGGVCSIWGRFSQAILR